METFAIQVVQELREANFAAFFAGGCVRDRLLGWTPKDFDVATDAKPEEVRRVFGYGRTLAIGASFGVVTVLGPKPLQVEVATFRSDGQYSDGRHPDGVTFSTAEEDARRRDFTINGMFFDPLDGRVIDYVGGERDLEANLIRAIGDPLERITEDRLRMLRAIRFAATYGFRIESATMSAVQSQAAFLKDVSQERITAELMRMLSHSSRSRALRLLRESQLLSMVLPQFDEMQTNEPAWDRLLQILDSDSISDGVVALAAILSTDGLRLGKQQVTKLGRALKLSNEDRNLLVWIVSHRERLELADELKFSELQPILIQPPIHGALSLLEAVATVDGSSTAVIDRCRELLNQSPEVLDPDPLLRGDDLMRLGMQPGPEFAKLLALVRASQLDGLIGSPEEAIAFLPKLRD